MGLTAVAAATVASGAIGAGASLMGASKQAQAAKDAANLQQQMYLQTRSDLSPFTQAGTGVLSDLSSLARSGPTGGGPDYVSRADAMQPGQMTQAELEATPGYQFTLGQGLKSTQSANAARGLGVSGAALKGAAQYATGLADSTYLNQFNIQQKRFEDVLGLNTAQQGNLLNQYNRLSGVATLGANAAAQVGTQGTALANQAGNDLIKAGTAQGSGLINASNALTSGVQNYLGYQQLQNMMNPQTTGYGGGSLPSGYTGPFQFSAGPGAVSG